MKRRSGKIFAATLALLVCLNAMPLGTLAADENAASLPGTEQTAELEPSKEAAEEPVEEQTVEEPAETEPTEDQAGEQPADVQQPEGTEQTEEPAGDEEATQDPASEAAQPEEEAAAVPSMVKSVASNESTGAQVLDETESLVYYVGGAKGDDTNEGTDENTPFATLKKAMDAAADGSTIYLLSDLTMKDMARVDKVSITIDGQGHTITRGEGFNRGIDTARGGYNPELIEVANGATLTLVNITLDDCNKTEGTVYEEQLTGSGDKKNEEKVQGAIIAAYGDGAGTIILGYGTTLKNFGGMSAVRIGGNVNGDGQWHGSSLIMKNGSRIIDDSGMGGNGRQGGFAAVWSQGGYVEMKEGSSISDIDGRAIYCEDGGTTVINGKISNITSNKKMVHYNYASNNGFGGIAVYSEAKASTITLGKTGTIHNIITRDNNPADVAIMLVGSTFEMLPGSSIKDIETIGLVDSNEGTMKIGGEVSNCHTRKVFFRMRGTAGTFELGETGLITKSSTTDPGIVYMNGGKPTITISGTMSDITASEAIFISNNGSRADGTCTVTETGVIKNVSGTAILAGDPSHVSISGEISNCGGYAVNYGAINYKDAQGSYLEINEGAKIQNNNNERAQICLSQGSKTASATDAIQHVDIAAGTLIGNQSVDANTSLGTITLDPDYAAIGLGKASAAAVEEINNQVQTDAKRAGWKVAGNALWFQPSEGTLHFTVTRPSAVERGIGLHVGYIPLGADGNPAEGAVLTLLPVTNNETIDVTLTGLSAGQSYALAFVVENKYYVTINPADITVYMGGEDGANNVVGADGKIYSSDSLPVPGFTFDLPEGVSDISQITFREVNGSKTWTAEPYDDVDGHTVYKLVSGSGQDPVRLQFTDESGKAVVEDKFTVGTELNKTFSMGIYKGNVGDVEAIVEGSATNITYGIILNEGTLTVRGTTSGVQYSKLNEDLQAGKPGVQADENVIFTINGSTVNANQDAIALLFDNIIENTNNEAGRSSLLTKKADEILKDVEVPAGMVRNYQFKYLDLVDTSNGNAWVEAKDANGDPAVVTVSWPYPEGTNKDTDFTLLHFEDLHRDMNSNEVAGDIASGKVSEVEFTKTDTHIEFTTTEFSPFALAWDGPKPTTPAVDQGSSDNGSTTTAPAATPVPAVKTAAQTATVIPQTGDDTQPALWAGLLVLSGAALTALYLLKRRKLNRER